MSVRTRVTSPRRHVGALVARLVPAAVAALALVACDDAPVTAPPHDGASLATDVVPLRDAGIDLTDTWLLAEATTTTATTVQYDVPTWDPATGREVTSVALPVVTEAQRTEAGYGEDGVIRINEYFAGDAVSGVAHVRIVGDSVAYFDASGEPRTDLPGAELIATLGSFRDDVVTDSMILPDRKREEGDGDLSVSTLHDRVAPALSVAGGSEARREIVSEVQGPGMQGRRVRWYRRAPEGWVLDEERRELRRSGDGASTTTTEVTRYHRVAWRNDLARDRARRELGREKGPHTGARRGERLPMISSSLATASAGVEVTTGARPSSSLTFWSPESTAPARYPSAPFSVALQHGAFSSASTWSAIAPALVDGFAVDHLLRESLDWKKEIEGQARDLHGRLAASGRRDFLVVGHSNGGLVARRAAQLSAAAGDSLVRGVVTIATAHAGVPLAKVGRATVHDFLTTQLRGVIGSIDGSCWRGQFAWLCDIAGVTSAELPGQIANFAMDAYMPMSRDVQPGSAFLAQLNATPESFRRYSIEVSSQGQWKFLRLFGDWRCDPSSSCGGNKLQNTMESVYEVLRICGSNAIARARLGHVSERCRDARWTLSSLNSQYERWIAQGDESDGLIPLASQQYPGAALANRVTRRNTKDSHAGELRSSRVRSDLTELLKLYLTS